MDDLRIGWALPCYGPIFAQVYASHLSAIAFASRHLTVERLGCVPAVGATDRMYLHSAANVIVEEALQADLTHLFWTESDMILPKDALPKLASLEKDIASGVYFLRSGGGSPCLFVPTPLETKENPYLHTPVSVYDERGPFKLGPRYGGCPGMGCVLIHMDVFRKIERPWFDLKANSAKTEIKDGYGQDLYFYTKVRWAKVEVWVHPGVVCDQVETAIIGYADYRKRLLESKGEFGGFIALDARNSAPR